MSRSAWVCTLSANSLVSTANLAESTMAIWKRVISKTTTTGNNDMAAKTGNSYISENMRDSFQNSNGKSGVFDMASSIKVLPSNATTTENRKWQDWRQNGYIDCHFGCRSLSQMPGNTWCWNFISVIVPERCVSGLRLSFIIGIAQGHFLRAELVWSKTSRLLLEFWWYLSYFRKHISNSGLNRNYCTYVYIWRTIERFAVVCQCRICLWTLSWSLPWSKTLLLLLELQWYLLWRHSDLCVNMSVKFRQFQNNLCELDVMPNNFRCTDRRSHCCILCRIQCHSYSGKVIKRLSPTLNQCF